MMTEEETTLAEAALESVPRIKEARSLYSHEGHSHVMLRQTDLDALLRHYRFLVEIRTLGLMYDGQEGLEEE